MKDLSDTLKYLVQTVKQKNSIFKRKKQTQQTAMDFCFVNGAKSVRVSNKKQMVTDTSSSPRGEPT